MNDYQSAQDIDHSLRGYLIQLKSREAQVQREFWTINNCTYEAYRKYTRHIKEFGFPDLQQQQQQQRKHSTEHVRRISSNFSESSASMLMRTVSWRSQGPLFAFKGMRAIIDDCKKPITVLSFGRLSSKMSAWGSADGEIFCADLDKESGQGTVLKFEKQHYDRIMDLDWSQDNQFILTAGNDNKLCMWDVNTGACVRSVFSKQSLYCCRFHTMNQNILLCGGSNGIIEAYNSSTGNLLQIANVRDIQDTASVTAMACSNTVMYVGDNFGDIHMLQCEIRNGVLVPLMFVSRTAYPKPRPSEIIRIQYQGYCAFTRGPSLLCSVLDGSVLVYKVYDTAGRLDLASQVNMPVMARRIYTSWCPTTTLEDAECIVTGGEDTTVTIYDIQRADQMVEINKLQGHSAPVVDVCWSYDEQSLASGDCNGLVIVWKREQRKDSGLSSRRISEGSWG